MSLHKQVENLAFVVNRIITAISSRSHRDVYSGNGRAAGSRDAAAGDRRGRAKGLRISHEGVAGLLRSRSAS